MSLRVAEAHPISPVERFRRLVSDYVEGRPLNRKVARETHVATVVDLLRDLKARPTLLRELNMLQRLWLFEDVPTLRPRLVMHRLVNARTMRPRLTFSRRPVGKVAAA